MGMQQVYIEVSGVGVEIVVPDLNPEHEGLSGHGGNCVGGGVVGAGRGNGRIDDDLLEGVEDFVVEGDQEKYDDADGENASENGPVLGFFPVPQQFCRVEEVKFVDYPFQTAQKSH